MTLLPEDFQPELTKLILKNVFKLLPEFKAAAIGYHALGHLTLGAPCTGAHLRSF